MDQIDLQPLLRRARRPQNTVLSVYLNVDQSQKDNENRGFENQLRNMMSSLQESIADPSDLERFRNAARHIQEFVSSFRIGARAIVMFLDEPDGFFWWKELRIPIKNEIRWSGEPFLLPLAGALDEYKACAVCLVGPVTHRLFVACCGDIEEALEETFPSRQAGIQITIMERTGPAHRIQREPAEDLRRNLRHVVKDIDWIVQARELDRIILAGAPPITSQLRKLLPKRLTSLVIGTLDISTSVSCEEVLTLTLPHVERFERAAELDTASRMMTAAGKGNAVVIGLEPMLVALNQGRISKLVYSDGLRLPGLECTKCGALFSTPMDSCKSCGAPVLCVADVVERAIERALRQRAAVEAVKGRASDSLNRAGGIGAFLKTKRAAGPASRGSFTRLDRIK